MADIRFHNAAHRDFFLDNMMKCRVNDCYHRAFFYVMGIAGKRGRISNGCLTLKMTVSYQRGCTADGRQAEQSRSAALPLISGTTM